MVIQEGISGRGPRKLSRMTDTPTDSPTTTRRKKPRADKGKANPNKAKRKRVLGKGEGDYCVYEVVPPDSTEIPGGALLPIPGVPRFTDTVQANRWIKSESGDLLHGKQVMVFRAMDLHRLTVEMTPVVKIISKPKMTLDEIEHPDQKVGEGAASKPAPQSGVDTEATDAE